MILVDNLDNIRKELFTIKFLHSGYQTPLDNYLNKGIALSPDTDTKTLFTNYRIDYRFFNNTLICFMQTMPFSPPAQQPQIPFIKIRGDIKIRFLVFNSSDFFDKTYVVAAGSTKTYQFSNQISNISGPDIYLTAGVEPFAAASDYDPGTVVQDGGSLYSAIQPVLASENILISNGAYWLPVTPFEQVVSNADLKDSTTVNADKNCLAVIDIYNSGTTNNSYEIFGANDALFNPAPSFVISFKSKI